jgi:type III restriction enzyme
MALHPKSPTSPCAPLIPEQRWFQESGATHIESRIRLKEMRPFRTEYRAHLAATKSIFKKVVGEPNSGGFELRFAAFLEDANDVNAFAKNYLAVGFKHDYVKASGDLANYVPDFIVRTMDGRIWLVETKGRAELDLPQKMGRLKQWCADATAAENADGGSPGQQYDCVFVDQSPFGKWFQNQGLKSFAALVTSFNDYKG